MSRYCDKCDSVILGDTEHDCLIPKQAGVKMKDFDIIWNTAIEAAAKKAQGAAYDVSNEIRKLKK